MRSFLRRECIRTYSTKAKNKPDAVDDTFLGKLLGLHGTTHGNRSSSSYFFYAKALE